MDEVLVEGEELEGLEYGVCIRRVGQVMRLES